MMKKIIAIMMAVTLLLMTAACRNGGQPSEGTAGSTAPETTEANSTETETEAPSSESAVKGVMHEFGRFSALVPEGWEAADLGGYQADYNGIIVKGKGEDFMTASSVSIIYLLPTEIFVSGAAFYEDVRMEGEFDLGGRHWEAWSGSMAGMSVLAAESTNDEGSVTVTLNMMGESGDTLTLEDPDVRAIIESIVVYPTVELDWIVIKDGIATASLPEMEGYEWAGSGTISTVGIEAIADLKGSQLTIMPQSGSGAFSASLYLENEDGTMYIGEANISIRVQDGKADAVYAGEVILHDEPQEQEQTVPEDDTDYEALTEFFSGTWADDNNDLTLFIQETDEVEHGCLINIQSESGLISAVGVIQADMTLTYESLTINGEYTDSYGYFMPNGDMLIWGRDDAAGEYEFGTIFSKLE